MPAADHAFAERNDHERERLRALVARLTDDDLRRPVTDRFSRSSAPLRPSRRRSSWPTG
ncbi:MAG TPA: hypothetical protein VLW53_08315 [Candidatus Eisenbacteria bacterium]|nr:hypothetical protein [Candidatus Eisenbacteria bacterium]